MFKKYKWLQLKDKNGKHEGFWCPFCRWTMLEMNMGDAITKIAYEYCPMCGNNMRKDKEE